MLVEKIFKNLSGYLAFFYCSVFSLAQKTLNPNDSTNERKTETFLQEWHLYLFQNTKNIIFENVCKDSKFLQRHV